MYVYVLTCISQAGVYTISNEIHICVYIYLYVCKYVCIYTHVYINIKYNYTYIYIYIQGKNSSSKRGRGGT
jgi:hypothetical protein